MDDKQKRDELIMSHQWLVAKEVNKFRRSVGRNHNDLEELHAEGIRSLVVAADTFKPELGDFVNYAGKTIYNELLKYTMKEVNRRKKERQMPLCCPRSKHDDTIEQQLDVCIDEPPDEFGIMLRNSIETAMDTISPEARELIRARFFEGKTLEEIASETGISHQAVHQRIERALSKMRKHIDPEVLHERSRRLPTRKNSGADVESTKFQDSE